jgi:hypothetical protein
MPLGEDIDKLEMLERREQILARRLKEAKEEREGWEREVYDRMLAEGWEPNKSSFNRNGVKFKPNATDYAVIQDADKLEAWLLADEGDDLADAGIVERKFKKGELNRIVRTKLDNHEALPPGLGYHTKTYVSKAGIMQRVDNDEQEDDDAEGQ